MRLTKADRLVTQLQTAVIEATMESYKGDNFADYVERENAARERLMEYILEELERHAAPQEEEIDR